MRHYTIIVAIAAVAVTVTVVGQNSTNNAALPKANEVVARVGDAVINRKDLDMAISVLAMQLQQRGQMLPPEQRPRVEHEILERLIGRELVLQSVHANPPAGLDEKVKTQLARTRSMAGSEETFNKSIQDAGLTVAEFEKRTRDDIMFIETLRQLVEEKTKITPDEIKGFYETNSIRFKQPETVRASHILVKVAPGTSEDIKKVSQTKINAARSLIVGGEKFADIARKVSDDTNSAPQGGDLGFFPRGATLPEFEKVAFSLPTNQVSEVITTQFGYHILIVTDRKPEKQLSLDEVKPDIEKFLRSRKGNDVILQYVKELRDKAKVEILLPPLPAPATNTVPPATAPKS